MNPGKSAVAAVLVAAPMLATPACANSEASIENLDKAVYCNEDVDVRATLSSTASSAVTATALLGLFNVDRTRGTILRKVDLEPGSSRVLSATIPWSQLADHRGEHFTLVADVGVMDRDATSPGSTLSLEKYEAALGSTANLYARATRTFMVCQ